MKEVSLEYLDKQAKKILEWDSEDKSEVTYQSCLIFAKVCIEKAINGEDMTKKVKPMQGKEKLLDDLRVLCKSIETAKSSLINIGLKKKGYELAGTIGIIEDWIYHISKEVKDENK